MEPKGLFVAFSLTPALSRWEREPHQSVAGECGAPVAVASAG